MIGDLGDVVLGFLVQGTACGSHGLLLAAFRPFRFPSGKGFERVMLIFDAYGFAERTLSIAITLLFTPFHLEIGTRRSELASLEKVSFYFTFL